jgi:hypothetical protein
MEVGQDPNVGRSAKGKKMGIRTVFPYNVDEISDVK